MLLKKPPIVEIWVEFKFDPNPDGKLGPAVSFLQEQAAEYPQLEISQEDRVEFRQLAPTKLPEMVSRQTAIKHIRAHSKDGARWLHLTSTQLVCNFLRLGESYPGFAAVSEYAIRKLARYVEVCKPVRIRYVAVHYVDVVEVPVPPAGEIELGDYFKLGLDLPKDPFGNQSSYLVRTTLQLLDGTGPLEIQLQYEGIEPQAKVFRFRIDWHKVCLYDSEVNVGGIPDDLKRAHESVMRCFRASFTERTWKLFEPTA